MSNFVEKVSACIITKAAEKGYKDANLSDIPKEVLDNIINECVEKYGE